MPRRPSSATIVLLAVLLGVVSTADTLAVGASRLPAATGQGSNSTNPIVPGGPGDPDQSGDRDVDLGDQPVLMLDRSAKPAQAPVIQPVFSPVAHELEPPPDAADRLHVQPATEVTSFALRLSPHGGLAHRPHGPPA